MVPIATLIAMTSLASPTRDAFQHSRSDSCIPSSLQNVVRRTRWLVPCLAALTVSPAVLQAQNFTFTTFAGATGLGGSSDGVSGAARFKNPRGVAADAAGNVYIADTGNNTIRKISGAGVVTTLAGSVGLAGSANGTGLSASFFGPQGAAADTAGSVYVTEDNHTIRRITAAAVATTLAGFPAVTGTGDGIGSAARFNIPSGVAVDTAGNLYVADSSNHSIRKISSTGVVTTLAGSPGLTGAADGAGTTARFNYPSGVAIDSTGNIYVADFGNHTVRKVTATGVVTTLAGKPGSSGAANGTGSAALFSSPSGLAVNASGSVFVTDQGNHTIRAISAAGAVTTVAGSPGVSGAVNGLGSTARFHFPTDIAVDQAGNIFIAESFSQTIRKGVPVLGPAQMSHISNLAIRAQAGSEAQTLIVGFQIGGSGTTGTKPVLLRAVGPTLGQFGVPGVLADPGIEIFNGQNKVDENDDWAGNAQIGTVGVQVGAFPFSSNTTKDAAIFKPALSAGSSSVWVKANARGTGVALAELYDATPVAMFTATTPRLTNVAARTMVGTGSDMLFAGFTISGTAFKTVLIRAIGPTLDVFGVPGTLTDPKLELFAGSTKIFENDNWGGGDTLADAFVSVGAFPLPSTSRDAALLLTLAPGSYTVQVSGVGGTTGVALVEVYEVP